MCPLRASSSFTFAILTLSIACDPGSDGPTSTSTGSGGTTTHTTTAPNPLRLVSTTPPGTVDMTPPAAGELDAFAQNRALGRGVNLGNGLDSPKGINWGLVIQPYMFQVIKDAGFDSIRLPVKWSAYAQTDAPYTLDESIFDTVDLWLAHALTRGLSVVLDIHHYGQDPQGGKVVEEGLYDQPEKYHAQFLAIWQQIATHYQSYPKELYFEILNEPRGALETFWNQYLGEAIAIIRGTNPGRTLIVGGGEYNKWYRLKDVTFPDDDNIIATFHYYNPYCFTMQDKNQTWDAQSGCNPPSSSGKPTGKIGWPVVYPTIDPAPTTTAATQRAKLEEDMADAAAWSREANRPLYMGEFGVLRTADEAARVDYTSSLARAAEKYGITWSYWEFGAQYGIWDQSALVYDQQMLDVLVPKQSDAAEGSAGVAGAPNAGSAGAGGSSAVAASGASGLEIGGSNGAGAPGSAGAGGTGAS
jgi:endoglucanase